MKFVLVIYSGANDRLVPELFDQHMAGGYTEFRGAHGAGHTGRREGTRAWPGDASIFFSIVPSDRVQGLTDALRDRTRELFPGERLHVAVLPTETFI
jgi:hypothetical protein